MVISVWDAQKAILSSEEISPSLCFRDFCNQHPGELSFHRPLLPLGNLIKRAWCLLGVVAFVYPRVC